MSKKLEKLTSLSEVEFHDLLSELLKRMGYSSVRIRQGTQEYGKDITYHIEHPTGITNYAVVAKIGDISGAAGNRGKLSTILATIKEQIDQAFTMPIVDLTDNRIKSKVNCVIVWTTGKITRNAEEQIVQELNGRYRNVEFKDGQKAVEFIDKYYPEYFSIGDTGLTTYFLSAKEKHSHLIELSMIGGKEHRRLAEIFIPLRFEKLLPSKSKQAKIDQIQGKKKRKKYFSYNEIFSNKKNIFIVGEMGSGKSTIIRKMLLDIVDTNIREMNLYPIPLLIRLKDINFKNQNSIATELMNEYKKFCSEQNTRDLLTDLKLGNLVIFLDGLDELETKQQRIDALQIIKTFCSTYPNNRVIITSRKIDIIRDSTTLPGFTTFQIQNLDISQATDLIANWFGNNSDGKKLIRLISQPTTFVNLPYTPLTMALVAVLYESGIQDLPASLTELFEKYTELALGRWDIGRNIENQIDWRIKQLLLRKISWDMLGDKTSTISAIRTETKVNYYKEERGLEFDTNTFIQEIVNRSGLLIETEDHQYEFKHISFRDYFAGDELSKSENKKDLIVENFLNPSWSRTIFFACGIMREADNYLLAILDNIAIPDNQAWHYAWNLGLLGQAAYLADIRTKERLVKLSIISFVIAWDNIVKNIDENSENNPSNVDFPHHIFVYIYSTLVKLAIGSSTLAKALTGIWKEQILNDDFLGGELEDKAQREWFIFFLAISCANVGEIDVFIEILEKSIIKNPVLLLHIKHELSILVQEDLENDKQKDTIHRWIRKIAKKINSNKAYLQRIIDSKPLPITDFSIQDPKLN